MTRDQWDELTVQLLALWPNKAIPDASFELWYRDLSEFPVEQVKAAVEAIYREGREWMPNGAQIRLRILRVTGRVRDWGRAYRLADQAASIGGEEGWRWLVEQDPLAAETLDRFGWHRWEFRDPVEETANRAAFRDMYRDVAEADWERELYRGIPGLPLPDAPLGLESGDVE